MTRQRKTPAQRAQEALDVARRQANRLSDQAAKLRNDLEAVERERDAAVVRRDYLAKNPDLVLGKPSDSRTRTRTAPSTPTTPTGDPAA